jgi:hypothetical protein
MKFEWFFVIFAPGTAGNHLSNMIATDSKFTSRADKDFYKTLINNAHTSNDLIIDNIVNQPLTGNTVTCCHLASYIWNQSKIDQIKAEKKYIVIELPTHARNSMFLTRLIQLYPYYSNEFLIEELSTFYSVNVVKKLIDTNDITPVTVDKIFNKNPTILVDYLYDNFGLKLGEQARYMHASWIAMLEKQ